MTGGKDELQQVVADIVIDCCFQVRHELLLPGFELAAEFLVLLVDSLVAAKVIDRTMLSRGHEPGPGIAGYARLGPLFEGGDQRILRKFLGDANVAYDTREAADEPGRFDPPDGAMGVGSCHCYRSHHPWAVGGKLNAWKQIGRRKHLPHSHRSSHVFMAPECA
jgi:hypothetical protein